MRVSSNLGAASGPRGRQLMPRVDVKVSRSTHAGDLIIELSDVGPAEHPYTQLAGLRITLTAEEAENLTRQLIDLGHTVKSLAVQGNRIQVYSDVERERRDQELKYSVDEDDRHTMRDWSAFITYFIAKGLNWVPTARRHPTEARPAMVKVAALAVAAIEAIDRQNDRLRASDDMVERQWPRKAQLPLVEPE